MNAIAHRILAGLLLVAVGVSAGLYARALSIGLAAAQDTAKRAHDDLAARDQTIRRLQDDAADKAIQQRKLDADRTGIDTKLAGIQGAIRRLSDENAELRAWAAVALPADVVRMHTSPTLIGAADYLARMPGSGALHIPGDGAEH